MAPLSRGSRGRGAGAPAPTPARAWRGGTDSRALSRSRDPLVSSRAGQKLGKLSLANRKFLIDKVLPIPHTGFKTKPNPSVIGLRAQTRSAGPEPLRRFGDPRPGTRARRAPGPKRRLHRRRQIHWPSGRARLRPRGGPCCHPPGPGQGRAGAPKPRALSGCEPRWAVWPSCRWQPSQRLPGGGGGGEAERRRRLGESRCGNPGGLRARPGEVPVETPCFETPAALRKEGERGARGGGVHPPFAPGEGALRPFPALGEVCRAGMAWSPSPIFCVFPLFSFRTLREIYTSVLFIEFSQERRAAFLGTLIFRVISYLTHVNT